MHVNHEVPVFSQNLAHDPNEPGVILRADMSEAAWVFLKFHRLEAALHGQSEVVPYFSFCVTGRIHSRVRPDFGLYCRCFLRACERAPNQFADRPLQDLAGDIPKRGLNGANGCNRDTATSPKTGAIVHLLPKPLDLHRVFTPQ